MSRFRFIPNYFSILLMKCLALGLAGFSAALENRTDQSPGNVTYTAAQSASVSKIPRLHSRFVRSISETDVHCAHPHPI
jgi:hypothetical protein